MTCTKLKDFDKENPNYQNLIDSIKEGKVLLDENNGSATILHEPLETRFPLGMKAYLENNGYIVDLVQT